MSLLRFHDLAKLRGDGLHPALRDLLAQRDLVEADPRVTELRRHGEPVQAGPNPQPGPGTFRPGNIIDFKDRATEIAVETRAIDQARGRS